ncbi:DUF6338 family protein [Lentzea albidocapillata]|uniref:Uncharacterized protein n=1 Tax=Lentzea albidocapillata TaxID=40571 RepID=A0A1W2A782_9PSEU|nr:DUF6338 family protein [Lentzea albidocapillata]SMC56517.1 hypothetical protein SAMN05660733_00510 [Lentzea albidocapillata]
MIPTTLVGLVLFIALLTPGFAYSARRERSGPERQFSALRETVAMVVVSVVCDLVVLSLALVVWSVLPKQTVDLTAFLTKPADYAVKHHVALWIWGVGLVGVATLLAVLVAGPLFDRLGRRNEAPYLSAWGRLFTAHPACRVHVGCHLSDGTYVAGWLLTYSRSAADVADRELTISGPVQYRAAGQQEAIELPNVGATAVSARQMTLLQVSYVRVAQPGTQSDVREIRT